MGREEDKEAYLRWRERSIGQIGTYNNVLIGLAGGGLVLVSPAFLGAEPTSSLGAKVTFAGASILLLSLAIGVFVMWNRAESFRVTAQIAWSRYKDDDAKAEELRKQSDALDERTIWWLKAQGFTFLIALAAILGGALLTFY